MKKQSIIILTVVAVAVAGIFYSLTGSQDQSAYLAKIQEERDSKDHFMRTSQESPFTDSVAAFQGLEYYPADIRYKITANLTPVSKKEAVLLATNDGKEQRYLPYAYADFDFNGYHNRLLILEMIDMDASRGKLFLAFGDETSAIETYGAGRYLDVNKVQGSNTITLDFNLAYNPYCAYSDKFSCPLPPAENLLKVAIRAGERQYH